MPEVIKSRFIACPDHQQEVEPVVSQDTQKVRDTNEIPPSAATPAGNRARVDNKVSGSMVDQILENSTALTTEAGGMERPKIQDMLRNMRPEEIFTGMEPRRKPQKDMANHKFWNTQPVVRFSTTIHLP